MKRLKISKYLKRNKVDGFENRRVIKSKRQAPNYKKILTNAEFFQKQVGVFKCPDKSCKCCTTLLLRHLYTFKNVDKTFNLKIHFTCDSSNLLYIVICPKCGKEHTSETGIDKTGPRDRVQVYQQHIRQPEYQKLKAEEHLKTCVKDTFKIFPLIYLQSS